ncbi:MAG: type II toxin-antitoxin system RelE/ParE family toxin [Burkholderiaceae bacterium]|nr:MAG: type II toxin-antitoxin system RelE/ParE family toxin [Burkholderiaceae bacterium]
MYNINWSTKSRKQFKRIDRHDRLEILDAVDTLQDLPNAKNVLALTKHKYDYRLRVGNYRILFDADSEVKIVAIQEVKRRDGNTY